MVKQSRDLERGAIHAQIIVDILMGTGLEFLSNLMYIQTDPSSFLSIIL